MFLSNGLKVPQTWLSSVPVLITTKRNKDVPVYGIMEVMKPHPKMEEGPQAGERFIRALRTVLSVPKNAVPNPFSKSSRKRKKPAARKG
jgi:hypothetical protein